MLRVVAAFLLACQSLPYGAVVFCADHDSAAAHCDEMTSTPSAPNSGTVGHSHSDAASGSACPAALLCAVSMTTSLPSGVTGLATPALAAASAWAALHTVLPFGPTASPFHPPKT